MRPRAFNKFLILSLLPSLSVNGSLAFGQTDDKSASSTRTNTTGLQFSSRNDEQAPADLKELRWMLSQIQKEKGVKDPLADYVEKPSSIEERAKRSDWKEDDEAHATPKLFKQSASNYVSPDLQPNLAIRKATDQTGPANPSNEEPNRRARVESVYDSCYIPILNRAPIPTKLVSSNSNQTALRQEVPFSSQPTTLPGLPGPGMPAFNPPTNPGPVVPVLPNNGGGGFNNGLGGAAATAPTYNPPVTGAPSYSSPSTMAPGPYMGNPIASPSPTLINPSPPGYSNNPTGGLGNAPGGGLVAPAPPATYLPPGGMGVGGMQTPTYDSRTGIVNTQPFVSAPPCQKDARYMVSPTVYRQNVGCNTCGNQSYAPNAGTGSPFSYVPTTYFPGAFNGYASQYRPLIGLGQDVRSAQLGRGIIGQPVAYMPSQPLRNVLRYLFP
ncbi:MAG: hypothetical protein MUC83_04765 [Pirellula sp.]|nr:hypothetical protein [Pirellula sp.]